MKKALILVVEDEPTIQELIKLTWKAFHIVSSHAIEEKRLNL